MFECIVSFTFASIRLSHVAQPFMISYPLYSFMRIDTTLQERVNTQLQHFLLNTTCSTRFVLSSQAVCKNEEPQSTIEPLASAVPFWTFKKQDKGVRSCDP